MKTYTSVHTTKKIAEQHTSRITARGGRVTVKIEKGKYTLTYYFPA